MRLEFLDRTEELKDEISKNKAEIKQKTPKGARSVLI